MDRKQAHGQPAFLLAQVGSRAAARFSERLLPLQLTAPDAGILRLLGSSGGISQQELSKRLGIHPSRLVAMLDNLEKKLYLERVANPQDRRLYSLYLTMGGQEMLEQIGQVARAHQDALLAALSEAERTTLTGLLEKIAQQEGLLPGIHPGYQRMGKAPRSDGQ